MPRAFTITDIFNQLNSDINAASNVNNTAAGAIELQTVLAVTEDNVVLSDMSSSLVPSFSFTASTAPVNGAWGTSTWGNFLWG